MVRQPAAGYASGVAGLDEARARSVLADMQDRLARGPNVALGITASSSPEDARAAFLQLTKVFHPVRFGRMANDIQKLANEVFLSLRAAHDQVSKTLRRPGGAPAAGAPNNGRGGQALPSRTARPPDTGERPVVPSSPTASGSGPTPGSVPGHVPGAPTGPTSGSRPPVVRPAQLGAARAPGVARPVGNPTPATARDEAAVIDLLQRQQWDLARSALHQLSARDPSSKRLRALEAYARGREAQLDRRLDDARVELQDALELDPDLQIAKTALTELFTRRK